MYKKILFSLIVLVLLASCSLMEATPAMNTPTSLGGSPGALAHLSHTDFDFLVVGISYDDVVARVGPPARDIGSGTYLYVYDLNDGSEMLLSFIRLDSLYSAAIRYPDGRTEFIVSP